MALILLACGPILPDEAEWPPRAKKWFERGELSYRSGDIDDAAHATEQALRLIPEESKVRLLGARVALANLKYDRAIQLLQGLSGSDARGLRSRAYWYAGSLDKAASELDKLLADPDVRDPWAKEIVKLARRGPGGKPFELSGGLLAVTEMPRMGSTALVVPLEIDGQPSLAMIATDVAEAVIDSSSGKESAWVSLRFGERLEVSNVPAMARDLSGISRQVDAPVQMLIGVNLLRHLHPTFDFGGGQFVVRTFDPPPPPRAASVAVSYARGGGMLVRGAFSEKEGAPAASFMINTSMAYPLALDEPGWKKAGVAPGSLERVGDNTELRHGILPMFRLGAMAVPKVAGVLGAPMDEIEKGMKMDLDGLVGSGFLAAFRVTLVDGGRLMWLEDVPPEAASWAPEPDRLAPPAVSPDLDGVQAPGQSPIVEP